MGKFMIFVAVSLLITIALFTLWAIRKTYKLFIWTLAVANGTLILLFLSFMWRAFPSVRSVSDEVMLVGGWGVTPLLDMISLGTALEFVLFCAAGIFFLARKTKPVRASLWSVIGVGLFAIVGHVTEVPWMCFSFGRFSSSMPVVTAVAFVVLAGIGLIAYDHANQMHERAKAAMMRAANGRTSDSHHVSTASQNA